MTTTNKLPRVLPLKEIVQRIGDHLRRLEADKQYNKVDPRYKTRRLYYAGAGVYGAKVGITYVTYQGRSLVTREEALSYLAALDGGFKGTHHEWLDKHPVAEKLPEVRYRALLRTRFHSYALYDVTSLTETRVYGRPIPRDEYAKALGSKLEFSIGFVGSYEDRRQILTRRGTMEMLKQLLVIEKEKEQRLAVVEEVYAAKIRKVIGRDDEP